MRRFFPLIILLFALSCTSTKEISQPDRDSRAGQAPIIDYTERELAEARSLYIRGLTAFEMQDYNEALDLLTMAYIKLPEHDGVNFALADAYMYMGDFTNAAYYARQAVDLDSANKFYHLKLAEIYFRAGQNSQVIESLLKAEKLFPNDVESLFFLATTYTEVGKYQESNDVYSRILNLQGPDLQIYYQRFRNFTMLEDSESATRELETLYELEPENTAIMQTLGSLYLDNDLPDKAIELYKNALDVNPNQPEIKISMSDLYIQQNDWEKAGPLLLEVMEDSLVDNQVKTELVQFLMSRFVRDQENVFLRDKTAQIVEQYAESNMMDAGAQAIAADFFLTIEDYDMALLKLRETIKLMPENEPAWRQMVQLLYTLSEFDELISIRDEAEKYVPEDAFIRFFVGNAYSITGDPQEAANWLELATEAPARSNFKSIVYGSLGDTYYSLDKFDQAWTSYEKSIELDSNNATSLNNYAYYLSVRNERIEEAYEMSKQSLENEPNNPSFLDTLGWIYFKMGNYDKAYEFISSSVDNGAVSATVYEHLGDVYDKLGNDEKAQEWWGKAFDTDPERIYLLQKLDSN
jgi:tetratricopeptide (TPR) repeat protein